MSRPTLDATMPVTVQRLSHLRLSLALHKLSNRGGSPLLLLHGLGERTPSSEPSYTRDWPGPVFGLDFTGHGESDVAVGGGYTSEALIGDVDAALARLGPSTLLGRGLGAYVALLATGARPQLVRGLILADGPGLAGGGATPSSLHILPAIMAPVSTPDPFALAELSRELRLPDLAEAFTAEAMTNPSLSSTVIVAAAMLPPWLQAVVDHPGVRRVGLAEAVRDVAARVCGK